MERLTVGDLLDRLNGLPRDAIVFFRPKGLAVSKIVSATFEPAEPPPGDPEDYNADAFKSRVYLAADEGAQVNRANAAIEALVNAAPDKRAAIRLKSEAGLYLTPEDLSALSDQP